MTARHTQVGRAARRLTHYYCPPKIFTFPKEWIASVPFQISYRPLLPMPGLGLVSRPVQIRTSGLLRCLASGPPLSGCKVIGAVLNDYYFRDQMSPCFPMRVASILSGLARAAIAEGSAASLSVVYGILLLPPCE